MLHKYIFFIYTNPFCSHIINATHQQLYSWMQIQIYNMFALNGTYFCTYSTCSRWNIGICYCYTDTIRIVLCIYKYYAIVHEAYLVHGKLISHGGLCNIFDIPYTRMYEKMQLDTYLIVLFIMPPLNTNHHKNKCAVFCFK